MPRVSKSVVVFTVAMAALLASLLPRSAVAVNILPSNRIRDIDFEPGEAVLGANHALTEDGWTHGLVGGGHGAWSPPGFASPAPSGQRAFYHETPASSDTNRGNSDRAEYSVSYTYYQNTDVWTGFSLKLDEDAFDTVDNWLLVTQFHQSAPESPPIAFEIKPGTDDQLRVLYRYGNYSNRNGATGGFDRTKNLFGSSLNDTITLTKGKWHHFVVHFIWQKTPAQAPGGGNEPFPEDGLLELWMDGQQIGDYVGPLGYTLEGHPNAEQTYGNSFDQRMGIYRSAAHINKQHRVYYDDVAVGRMFSSVVPDGFYGPGGDFDGDRDVDGNDFLMWQRDPGVGALADWETNYGNSALRAVATAVPEPSSLLSLGIGGIGLLMPRRRIANEK